MGQIPFSSIVGTRGIPRYVDLSTSQVTNTAYGTVTVYSTKIPAKTIAKGGSLETVLVFTAMCTDVSNAVELEWYLGGTHLGTFFALTDSVLDGSTKIGFQRVSIRNLGAYNSQLVEIGGLFGGFPTATESKPLGAFTAAVDTSVDCTLRIDAQWLGSGNQNFTKKYVGVQVFNPLGVLS
jgi:hypothetical protein